MQRNKIINKRKGIENKFNRLELNIFLISISFILIFIGALFLSNGGITGFAVLNPESITFERTFSCSGCSSENVPADTEINVLLKINAEANGALLTEYYPADWTLIDPNGGIADVSDIGEEYLALRWTTDSVNGSIVKNYIVKSSSAGNYSFVSKIDEINGNSQIVLVNAADNLTESLNETVLNETIILNETLVVNETANLTEKINLTEIVLNLTETNNTNITNTINLTRMFVGEDLVYPTPSFVHPTPDNATRTTNTSVQINVSIIEQNLGSLVYNWNGTNYSLYDNNLLMYLNFNNYSNIGDHMAKAVDVSKYSRNATIKDGWLDDFENGINGWAFRDAGNWLAPQQDCSTAASGSCSINTTTTAEIFGSIFINSTQVYPMNGMVIEFDYKCEAGLKWGVMTTSDTATWYCIQGTGTANCGSIYTAKGAFSPAITCDNTWRHANYSMDWGTTNNTQTIIGDWSGTNTANKKLWIDNFVIHSASTYTPGKYGMGMSFDGYSDYIYSKGFSEIGTSDKSYSFTGWFNAATGETDGDILFSSAGWCLPPVSLVSSKVRAYSWAAATGGANTATSTTTVNAGTWYFFAHTWNATDGLKIYINGKLENTTAQADYLASSGSNTIWVGGTTIDYSGCSGYKGSFNGTIDEIGVWNRSLSANEIYELYASNLQKYNSTQWYLSVNQSLNATNALSYGTYTYQTFAADASGNLNSTDLRTINLQQDLVYPLLNFTSPTPGNATIQSATNVLINVSIIEQNLNSLIYNWNTTNYTMYNDSLVLMMNFDNLSAIGENNTLAVDVSKFSNNGTIIGATWNATGKYNGGINFDGIDDSINLGSPNELDVFTNGLTVSAWIRPNSGETSGGIYRKRNTNRVELSLAGDIQFQVDSDTQGLVTSYGATTITGDSQTWYYVAGTYNETNMTLYLNGIKDNVTAQTGDVTIGGTDALIGYTVSGAIGYFNGLIDEVRIWNRSLSADEIYEQYASNLQKYNSTQWYLYINQSLNSTNALSDGTYTYQTFASDVSGNLNSTDLRTIIISPETAHSSINFTSPTLANATITNISILINVSIVEPNLNSVIYTWNTTNYTMYNDSLVLMMNFDNLSAIGENNTLAVDVSKYSNNGTIIGSTWNSTGKYNGALNFDGNDYVNASNPLLLRISNNITMSAWIKSSSSFASARDIIGYMWHFQDSGILLGFNPNSTTIHYVFTDGGLDTLDVVYNIADGNWHHLLSTFSSGDARIYVDGALKGNKTSSTVQNIVYNPAYSVFIGRDSGTDGEYWNGQIDEVRVWNRTLTASEVYEQYVSNLNKFNSTQWYLYVNQSLNSTADLSDGNYTYQVFSIDTDGNQNSTDLRTAEIRAPVPSKINLNWIYPTININVSQNQFFNVSVNVTCLDSDCGEVNVSLDPVTYGNLTYDTFEAESVCSDSCGTSCVLKSTNWTNKGAASWTSITGDTSSTSTGPAVDHTLGTASGHYLYTEASNPCYYSYHLDSDPIDTSLYSNLNLTFWYHMYGAAMGSLHVDINESGTWTNDTWTVSGQQQASGSDAWLKASVDLSSFTGTINIRIRGLTSSSTFTSDMAIDDITVAYATGTAKGGLISNVTGTTPFYTNTTNPYNISLNADESAIVTWYVNATGSIGDTYEFYVYSNKTSNMSVSNLTTSLNITTKDLSLPDVSIVYPTATTYDVRLTALNYTYSDTNPGYCWYSTDNGATNSTNVTAGINWTGLSSTSGDNTWTVYCNDTYGNLNSSSVTFTSLIPAINLDLIYPTTNINVSEHEFFNVTVNISCSVNDCGEINLTLDPTVALGTQYNFTTCGVSGRFGPTQTNCTNTYTGTTLAGLVNVTNGIQNFTIPVTGTYRIDAYGAQGGLGTTFQGGNGSKMSGIFSLNAGDVLLILVGQAGQNWSTQNAGGGGGGTFVTYLNNTPLIIAGGGGGGGSRAGLNASTNTSGFAGLPSGNAGGTNGSGGSATAGTAGGGGLLGNGTASTCTSTRGMAFVSNGSGGIGGTCAASGGAGGFGGGSGGEWCCQGAAGAGGGYSGGGGALGSSAGGGGGSYNIGTSQTNTSGISSDHGKVTFELINVTGKNGLVSTNTSATPFYTNTTNPYNLTLTNGSSQLITWWVNATGSIGDTYEFYVYANKTSDLSNGNETIKWNVTTKDTTIPVVNILFPLNITYGINASKIEYSYTDLNPGYCWYSTDGGATNSSNVSAGTNFTGVASSPGTNTWILYCNDTTGNLNITSVTFNRNVSNVMISWIYPTSNITVNQNEFFNVSVNVTCLNNYCGEINVSLDPDTSVQYNFTTCGITGTTGPSQAQCNTNYTGTTLAGLVTVKNGIQNFTIPTSGTYQINVSGAKGAGSGGGKGANMSGEFTLVQGDVLQILVGQTGTVVYYGGGGGGSFVAKGASYSTATPLIVAGAGGGDSSSGSTGLDGVTTTSGTDGRGATGNAGVNGGGGGAGTGGSSYKGAGGGGFYGNGTSATRAVGGFAFVSGGAGGTATTDGAGGFGGGGGNGYYGGGGGGGYSGGGGGIGDGYAGGSGGSYNNGTNQVNTSGANIGYGIVKITLLSSSSAKGGLVSTTAGTTPFYTNTTNPYNISLNADESAIVTWYVNGTGSLNTPYEFYAYINITDDLTVNNQTIKWNISLQDLASPIVNITYPANMTYTIHPTALNYTYKDFNPGYCWYSINEQATINSSRSSANTNWTGLNDGNSSLGANVWILYCNDTSGNWNYSTMNFTVNLPPSMRVLTPSNNTFTSDTLIDINYTVSDTDLESCWYSNGTYLSNTSITCGTNITDITWQEGADTILIYANDSYGTVNVTSVKITIDTIIPLINISSPLNLSNSTNSGLDVNYIATDVNRNSCWYSNDTYTSNTTLTNCANLTTITWKDGWHNVTIWTNDSAGNRNSSSVTFLIDATPPNLTILTPTNNTYTTDTLVDINYTVGSDAQYCWYSNDTMLTNISLTCGTNITDIVWTEGRHNISIWANDTLGNRNLSTRLFNIDLTNPNVSLILPANNTYNASTLINFTFNVTDNLGVKNATVYIYNSTGIYNTSTVNFSNQTTYRNSSIMNNLIDGVYNWSVAVWDQVGFIALTANRTIIIDTTKPAINITSPLNGSNTTLEGLDIAYSVSDTYLQSCWYTNDTMKSNTSLADCGPITDITWTVGKHNVTIWANDSAGNRNSSFVIFTLNAIRGPTMTLVSPANGTVTTDTGLDINYISTDDFRDSCWYSADSGSNTSLANCANITSLTWTEGQHTVNIWSNNSNAFESSLTVTFTIDLTDPVVTILYPSDSLQTNDAGIDINYTLSETNIGSCWYSNDTMTSNTTLSGCANITSVTWTQGSHNVIVYANDSAGHTSSDTVAFTVDSIAPFVNISYPINNSNSTNIMLNINYTATDNNLQSCWYSNDTMTSNTTLSSCSNITSITWTEGTHNVTIWANDSYGNKNSSFRIFSIDSVTPTLTILTPTNNTFTTDTLIDINYSVSDSHLSSCRYSNDTYLSNTTITCGTNITTITWTEGQHNITIWANDTFGNINEKSLRLTVDTTKPAINITYPLNGSNTTNIGLDVLYNVSDINLQSCWYSNDSMTSNITLEGCANITTITWTEIMHNVTIWVNDSAGNRNSSTIFFNVDATMPTLTILTPANNTFTTDTLIDINYSVSDSHLSSCRYSNDTYLSNTTITCGTNITTITWTEGQHNITIWANDTFGNVNEKSLRLTIDNAKPLINITSPINGSNTTNAGLDILYTVSDTNLQSCWYSNDTMKNNITLAGCVNITNVTWSDGWHNITIWTNDSAGNRNSSSVNFWHMFDSDNDTLADTADNLLYNESYVNTTGIGRLNITVDRNNTNGSYDDVKQVIFYDQAVKIINLTYNFTASTLDLSKIKITKAENSIIINLSQQVQENYNKTVYITDNSFIGLCVKDMEIASIDEISSNCNGTNETNFVSCLGNSNGTTNNGSLTCYDEGTTIRIENLRYSAVKGTVAAGGTGGTGGTGGAGGGGGGGGSLKKIIECTLDSDCKTNEFCSGNRCIPLFDIIILRADSPVEPGQALDFSYFIKGMGDINTDVAIKFWIERDGAEIVSGQDMIYLGSFEEKTMKSSIYLPTDMIGKYTLFVELDSKDYSVKSSRPIEVAPAAELAIDMSITEFKVNKNRAEFRIELNSNKDESANARLNISLLREGKAAWNSDSDILINKTKTISEKINLEPGNYVLQAAVKYGYNKEVSVKKEFSIIETEAPVDFGNTGKYLLWIFILLIFIYAGYYLQKKKSFAGMKYYAQQKIKAVKYMPIFENRRKLIEKIKEPEERRKTIRRFLHDVFGMFKTRAEIQEIERQKRLGILRSARERENYEEEKISEKRRKLLLKQRRAEARAERAREIRRAIRRFLHNNLGMFKTEEELQNIARAKNLVLARQAKEEELCREEESRRKARIAQQIRAKAEQKEQRARARRLAAKRFLHDNFGMFKTKAELDEIDRAKIAAKAKIARDKAQREEEERLEKARKANLKWLKAKQKEEKRLRKEEEKRNKRRRKLLLKQRRAEARAERVRARRLAARRFFHDNFGMFKTKAELDEIKRQEAAERAKIARDKAQHEEEIRLEKARKAQQKRIKIERKQQRARERRLAVKRFLHDNFGMFKTKAEILDIKRLKSLEIARKANLKLMREKQKEEKRLRKEEERKQRRLAKENLRLLNKKKKREEEIIRQREKVRVASERKIREIQRKQRRGEERELLIKEEKRQKAIKELQKEQEKEQEARRIAKIKEQMQLEKEAHLEEIRRELELRKKKALDEKIKLLEKKREEKQKAREEERRRKELERRRKERLIEQRRREREARIAERRRRRAEARRRRKKFLHDHFGMFKTKAEIEEIKRLKSLEIARKIRMKNAKEKNKELQRIRLIEEKRKQTALKKKTRLLDSIAREEEIARRKMAMINLSASQKRREIRQEEKQRQIELMAIKNKEREEELEELREIRAKQRQKEQEEERKLEHEREAKRIKRELEIQKERAVQRRLKLFEKKIRLKRNR